MESLEKRSLKKTNSRQFQMLVTLMQENVRLAKCLPASRNDKISIEDAWDIVACKVNSFGPPFRTASGWKRVWADLKSRTKKKIFERNKNIGTYEERFCASLNLNDLEQSIDRILNFSSIAAQVLEESPAEITYESVINGPLKLCEIKTENDSDIAPENEILDSPKISDIKRRKPLRQFRVMAKRKYDKSEKQLKLLERQIKAQEKFSEAMQMQGAASETIAEAASSQADSMAIIAESMQSIATAAQDAVKYLKPH